MSHIKKMIVEKKWFVEKLAQRQFIGLSHNLFHDSVCNITTAGLYLITNQTVKPRTL